MIIDGNNIEAQQALFHVAFGEEALRRSHNYALLLTGNTEFRQRGGVLFHRARANFHKGERLAIIANQIQFALDSSGV